MWIHVIGQRRSGRSTAAAAIYASAICTTTSGVAVFDDVPPPPGFAGAPLLITVSQRQSEWEADGRTPDVTAFTQPLDRKAPPQPALSPYHVLAVRRGEEDGEWVAPMLLVTSTAL